MPSGIVLRWERLLVVGLRPPNGDAVPIEGFRDLEFVPAGLKRAPHVRRDSVPILISDGLRVWAFPSTRALRRHHDRSRRSQYLRVDPYRTLSLGVPHPRPPQHSDREALRARDHVRLWLSELLTNHASSWRTRRSITYTTCLAGRGPAIQNGDVDKEAQLSPYRSAFRFQLGLVALAGLVFGVVALVTVNLALGIVALMLLVTGIAGVRAYSPSASPATRARWWA